jgi:hypothetical protein
VTLQLTDEEVAILRHHGRALPLPAAVVDKLLDAVDVREPGWYLVQTVHAEAPRPRWWSGKKWFWGPDHENNWSGPAVVTDDSAAVRLYMEEER